MDELNLQLLYQQLKDLINRVEELEKEFKSLKDLSFKPKTYKKVNGVLVSSLDNEAQDE